MCTEAGATTRTRKVTEAVGRRKPNVDPTTIAAAGLHVYCTTSGTLPTLVLVRAPFNVRASVPPSVVKVTVCVLAMDWGVLPWGYVRPVQLRATLAVGSHQLPWLPVESCVEVCLRA